MTHASTERPPMRPVTVVRAPAHLLRTVVPQSPFPTLAGPQTQVVPVTAETSDVADLHRSVSRGVGWSVVNTLVGRLGGLVTSVVMARLLVPEDYGVFAVALVTMTALLSINELGTSLPLLRWPYERAARASPTVATLALATSVVFFAAAVASAPVVANALGSPEAVLPLQVLAVAVLLDALTTVPNAWVTRMFLQRRRAAIDLTAFALSTVTSIALAVAGAGAWALVAGYLLANAVTTVLLLTWSPWRMRLGYSGRDARAVLAFGLPLAGASLLNFAVLNVDYVVVGALLGPAALGFYVLAFNLASYPGSVVTTAVRRVSTAAFARLDEHRSGVADGFVTSTRLVLLVTFPACAGLAGLALPLVATVYGDTWQPAADALQLLVVLGAARVLLDLAYDYLVAVEAPRATAVLQALWLVVLVPTLVIGATVAGFPGAAAAHAVVAVVVMLPALVVAVGRHGVPVGPLVRAGVRPLVAALLVLGVTTAAVRLLDDPWTQLFAGSGAAAVVVAAMLAPMRTELLRLVRGRA